MLTPSCYRRWIHGADDPLVTVAAETIQRTVRGVVTATNTAVDPQTIVVNVVLPNKEALIVARAY
jgi:hypothetical protein